MNCFFSGGADNKIKLWNLTTGTCEREIVGHKSPVSGMILFENPFEWESRKNYVILSCGISDEFLRVSTALSPINNGLLLDERVGGDVGGGPVMQVIRDNADDSVQVAVISQVKEDRYFIIMKIR